MTVVEARRIVVELDPAKAVQLGAMLALVAQIDKSSAEGTGEDP